MSETSTKTVRLYEGMFLMSQQTVSLGLNEALLVVRAILERAGAEIVALSKWDDRKLAYPIKGQKRGTFLLAHFRVDGVQIANIERDCNLGDDVLRVMITNADHMGEVEIEAAKQNAASESVGCQTQLRLWIAEDIQRDSGARQ